MQMMQKKPSRDAQTFTIKHCEIIHNALILGNSFHKRAISPSMSFPGFYFNAAPLISVAIDSMYVQKISKNAALRVMYWYKNGRFWSPLRVMYGCFADVR